MESWNAAPGKTEVASDKTKRCTNRAAQALRLAAAALRSSQSALGAYFRRLRSRMDKPKAVTAAAHKLARLILLNLSRRAQRLGMTLVAIEQPA